MPHECALVGHHYRYNTSEIANFQQFVDSNGSLEIFRHLGLFKKRMYLELRGMLFELILVLSSMGYRSWVVGFASRMLSRQ